MKSLYTAQVSVTSGRDGRATSPDGLLDLVLGFPKELGGAGNAVNPEQLFAAGYAACFASSIKAAANTLSVKIGQVSVEGDAVLSTHDDGSFIVSHVELRVRAEGLTDQADAVFTEAKRICAYSNATRGNTVTTVKLAGG
jgi:lipoyl-dependent peroxiredoxin